ncbi:MAG TPA: LPS export ABC transporter periplasmic protein LptC [Gemmatimonadaceae bacterium]|nr:LPS export ABC transporter periplasmic protein LptC [Gemmatimonadaceae bacterium]
MRRIACALAAAVAILSAACQDSQTPPVAAVSGAADSADQVLFKAHYVVTTNGIKRGDLTADTAYVLDDQTRYDLRNAHVVFTTEIGAPEGTMEANRGVYSTRTQILEGWGNVVVKSVTGKTLRSPHVIFNQATHQITSDTTYTITRGTDTQHGIGFTSTPSFYPFKCLRSCGGTGNMLLPER